MRRETVNIVVIGYNLLDLEDACLSSVLSVTKHPYMLTYFDNYESGCTLTAIWNLLIEHSPCEYICLLNNDTVVSDGWLSKLMCTLLGDDTIGFIGPSTSNCHSPQKLINTFQEAQKHPDEVEVMDDPISGFCLVFRKSLWEALGRFDERYELYGQESDLQDKAQKQGYKCVWRKDAFVYHVGEASIKSCKDLNVRDERMKARKIYWGDRGRKI